MSRQQRYFPLLTATLLALPAVLPVAAQERAAAQSGTVVTLLGTAGGPGGLSHRAGIASVVSVGERHYLIDAGEGIARQLARAGFAETDISRVFLTHLHDDHTVGLPSLTPSLTTVS